MKEINGLTGLRGYAALWVFFLHATWGWPGDSLPLQIARMGGSGVTIFFVLSGFILAYVYGFRFEAGRESYGSFMWARLARVYPLHIVSLLLFAGLAWSGYIDFSSNDNGYTLALNLGLVQAWGFTQLVSWNQPSWSISAELFAYLFFPLIIGVIMRARLATLAILMGMLFYCLLHSPYAVLVAALQRHGLLDVGGKQFAHGLSLAQFQYMFCVGVVLYAIASRLKLKTIVCDALMLCGIGLLLYWSATETGDLSLWQGTLCAALLVLPIFNETKLTEALFGNPIAHYLGRISYALYLTAILAENVALRFIHPLPLAVNLILSLLVAALLHHLIEVPARNLLRSLAKKVSRPVQAPRSRAQSGGQ